jgi:radical SAM superfamily enzyme YgiQ (UPF0313 family)
MKKRIVLTYPNQRWQQHDINTVWDLNPATLCLLAAMIGDVAEVKIIDCQFNNISLQEFKEQIIVFKPHYVGISVMTSEYQDTLDIVADLVKKVDASIITIAGGVHVTTKYEYVMKNPNLDYAVRGEGEYTLRTLLRYLNHQGELPSEGIVYRDKDALVVLDAARVKDLSMLPWPDYSLIDLRPYLEKGARFGPNRPPQFPAYKIVTTRGCPCGCSFCQVELISGKTVRARNPLDIVKELLWVQREYGIKSVVFEDDNLLMADGGRFAKELFQLMIQEKLNVKWTGIAFAIFLLTDELLDLMADSGCKGINVAIESGNERVLRDIVEKKMVKLDMVPEMISKITERGMYCIANFIIGFPGETWDEIRETVAFAENCGADYVKFFVAVPLYGTKLYNTAVAMGAIRSNEEYPKTDWRHSQISSEEWTSEDISILRAYEWDRINFKPEKIDAVSDLWGMGKEEINNIRKATRNGLT